MLEGQNGLGICFKSGPEFKYIFIYYICELYLWRGMLDLNDKKIIYLRSASTVTSNNNQSKTKVTDFRFFVQKID